MEGISSEKREKIPHILIGVDHVFLSWEGPGLPSSKKQAIVYVRRRIRIASRSISMKMWSLIVTA